MTISLNTHAHVCYNWVLNPRPLLTKYEDIYGNGVANLLLNLTFQWIYNFPRMGALVILVWLPLGVSIACLQMIITHTTLLTNANNKLIAIKFSEKTNLPGPHSFTPCTYRYVFTCEVEIWCYMCSCWLPFLCSPESRLQIG